MKTCKTNNPDKKVIVDIWRQTKIKTNTMGKCDQDLIPDGINKDDFEIIIICKDKKTESIQKTDKFVKITIIFNMDQNTII